MEVSAPWKLAGFADRENFQSFSVWETSIVKNTKIAWSNWKILAMDTVRLALVARGTNILMKISFARVFPSRPAEVNDAKYPRKLLWLLIRQIDENTFSLVN